MSSIKIFNQTKFRIPRQLILSTLSRALRYLKIKDSSLSIAFVNQSTIRKLNFEYRKKDKATDVLSFTYFYDKNKLDGEIIICYSIAARQSKKYGHSVSREIIELLIHALLHLVGYDHHNRKQAQSMEELEDKIIKNWKLII